MVRTRLKILMLVLAGAFAVVIARLAYLQLVPSVHAENWRLSQHRTRTFSAPIRGRILSRDGKVLAGNEPLYQLYFNYPRLNPRREALAAVVREIKKRSPFPDAADVERRLLESTDVRSLAVRESDDAPDELLPLVENVDAALATRLERRLKSWPGFFVIAPGQRTSQSLWFRPRRLFSMEISLHRLAALLGPPESAESTYVLLQSRIDSELARIETLIEKEAQKDTDDHIREDLVQKKKESARRLYHKQSWLLASGIPPRAVTEIEYHPSEFPGIEVEDGVRRVYPERETCGTLTGYLRRIGTDDEQRLKEKGLLIESFEEESEGPFAEFRSGKLRRTDLLATGGLEQFHDESLRGHYGTRVERVDKLGQPRELLEDLSPEDGADVRITIDASLQRVLYEAFQQEVRPFAGTGVAGSAAVMSLVDGEQGALLASVGFPGIDPNRMTNDPGAYTEELVKEWKPYTDGWLLDRPSRHALFPGSVFKLVLAAGAMEAALPWQGAYTPERRYECKHEFPLIPGVHCSVTHGHTPDGTVDLREALQYSCNTYFYYVGLQHLQAAGIHEWASHFGFGSPTGVDLPPHPLERGILKLPREVKGKTGECHYSIGQTYVQATPLQVLRSVAAVALGNSVLPRPYLVTPRKRPETLPIRNPRTWKVIREGMWRVGHAPGGTAAKFHLDEYNAAYKTGTAEVLSGPDTPHHAWLVGFAPFEAPRIAFVIVIEKTPLHGADACAPVARRLLEHFAEKEPGLFRLETRPALEERKS